MLRTVQNSFHPFCFRQLDFILINLHHRGIKLQMTFEYYPPSKTSLLVPPSGKRNFKIYYLWSCKQYIEDSHGLLKVIDITPTTCFCYLWCHVILHTASACNQFYKSSKMKLCWLFWYIYTPKTSFPKVNKWTHRGEVVGNFSGVWLTTADFELPSHDHMFTMTGRLSQKTPKVCWGFL